MPEFFVYLLKVNLALVLFYLVYYFLLRRLTFYTLNRVYLLFSFGFSALYPLLNVSEWFKKEQSFPVGVQYIIPDWDKVEKTQFSIWPILEIVFWLIAGIIVIRFLIRLFSLWQIHRESTPAKWQLFQYRYVFRHIEPFTFLRNIYVHVDRHADQELKEIFNHEQIHADQMHTADILIAELFTIVCWFNPMVWMMRYSIQENLEFITDRKVLNSGVNKQSYQYSLLNLVTSDNSGGLVNNFNLKHLKNRIRMMNKSRSSYIHLGKYVLTIPLVVGFALVFTLSKAYQPLIEEIAPVVKLTDVKVVLDDKEGLLDQDSLKERVQSVLQNNLNGSVDSVRIRIENVGVQAVAQYKDTIYGNMDIFANDDVMAIDKNQPEKVVIRYKKVRTSNTETVNPDVPYVLIDGKEANIEDLNPNQIKSIKILKGGQAEAYAKAKAKGVGVILIETKP